VNLKDKKVLVTGAAIGIGFATSHLLLKKGAHVIMWDIDVENLQKASIKLNELGFKNFSTFQCDVSNSNEVYQTAKKVNEAIGTVDILINNAGTVYTGYMLDRTDEELEKMIQINFTSMIYTIRAFMPEMLERNFGHIINISSASSLIGAPKLAVYAATKWAVAGLTESLRLEAYKMNRKGVKFSSIHPNFLVKGLFAGTKLNFLGNLLSPGIKSPYTVAKVIINRAIRYGFHSPKIPWIMNQATLLRAILPSSILLRVSNLYGLNNMMDQYEGYNDGR
jgi:short-subunit dehydrogenase